MVIKNNLVAINSQRYLLLTVGKEKERAEKLSSGYRINRSADDAAGLSISEKMRRQIRGLGQASTNAQDGISLLQSAEGALQEVHGMLQRMNELAVRAANGTNSGQERDYIQKEVTQMITEVNRVATTSRFNEIAMFDGSLGRKAPAGSTTPKLTILDAVTYQAAVIEQTEDPFWAAAPGNEGIKQMLKTQLVPQAVQALVDTFDDTFGYLSGSNIGIGLHVYNDASDGVLAAVSMGAGYWSNYTPPKFELEYRLSVNIGYLDFIDENTGELTDDSRLALEATIAHEMMHGMMMEALTAGMGEYDQWASFHNDGFPTWFVEGTAQSAGGGMDWVRDNLKLDEQSTDAEIQDTLSHAHYSLDSDSVYSHYGTGYLAAMYLGYLVNGKTSAEATAVAGGLDFLMSEVRGGKSLDQAIADHTDYQGLSDFETKFAVDSTAFIRQLLALSGNGMGALVADNYTETDLLDDAAMPDTIFNLNTEYMWVNNIYPDGYIVISGGTATKPGAEGPDYVPADSTGTTTPGQTGGGDSTDPTTPTSPTTPINPTNPVNPGGGTNPGGAGGLGFVYLGGITLQVGNETGETITVYIEKMDAASLGIEQVNLSTREGASEAITTLKEAIHRVSTQRAALGAYQNRLEHTIQNLDNVTENTQAAESRIRDADMAREMVGLASQRLIRRAGEAMLAQTKQQGRDVLSLLTTLK